MGKKTAKHNEKEEVLADIDEMIQMFLEAMEATRGYHDKCVYEMEAKVKLVLAKAKLAIGRTYLDNAVFAVQAKDEPEMTGEEFDFLMNADRYMNEKGTRHPTWLQMLDMVKSLGYRKVSMPDATAKSRKESTISLIPKHYCSCWTIEMVIAEPNNIHAHEIGFLIFSMGQALETIEGATVILEDWGMGSFRAKLKGFFRTARDHETTKEILDSARKRVEGELEKPFEDKENVREQTKEIKKRTASMPEPEQAKRRHDLELESAQLDNQRKAIENFSLALDTAQKAGHLIAEGILSIDSLRIDMNGLLYLNKQGNLLQIGEPIDVIAEAASSGVKPKKKQTKIKKKTEAKKNSMPKKKKTT